MKLVDFDQTNLLEPEKFYATGLKLKALSRRSYTARAIDALRELWSGKTREGFTWEQKGPTSFHLRPAAFEYEEAFFSLLWDNDIPGLLERLTGRHLHLYHVQVVKTVPGPSYQDWHRDAYQFGSDPFVGAFPSAVKVNVYPEFEGPEPRLKYIPGSHRCMANDARFDEMLVARYEHEILNSSNAQALVFESSMLHGVVPDVNPKGSIRLMYSFAQKHEYEKRFAGKPHHKKLHDKYVGFQQSLSHDAVDQVKDYVNSRINQGYGGNPYVNDLESELKYDGRVEAWEDVVSHIEWMKEQK